MADNAESSSARPTPVQKQEDFGKDPAKAAQSRYCAEIDLYNAEFKNWKKRAEGVVKRYRDERPEAKEGEYGPKKLNILYSNIETMKPAVYGRPPVPDVQRRYKDADPVGRVASTVLERGLTYTVDQYDLNGVIENCVTDYLLAGRGQGRVRYEFEKEDLPGLNGQMVPTVTYEKACIEYVFWDDFGHSIARTWPEVDLVWFRAYLTYDQLVEKFTEEVAKKIPLDTEPPKLSEEQRKQHSQVFKTACIYEIWDKKAKKTVWISKTYLEGPLKEGPPPINFDGFFPCPKPLYGPMTTESLIPLPDYCQYQDQADELDQLTARINLLTNAIRVAGVYDGSMKDEAGQLLDLKSLVTGNSLENKLIPVDKWGMFAEKGGLKGVVDFFPLDVIITCVMKLYEARAQVKQDLYEVSGMSDVLRGATDPDETAAAQKLKGRFGSMRLEDRQANVAEFAKGLIRLAGEVIAEQFSPKTLQDMTGIKLPMEPPQPPNPMAAMMTGAPMPPPMIPPQMQAPQPPVPPNGGVPTQPAPAMPMPQQSGNPAPMQPGQGAPANIAEQAQPQPVVTWPQVIDLLRDDVVRGFRIDIETDSTIAADEEAEKEAATELMNVATPFLEKMAMAAQQMPAMLPILAETFMQVIRRFKLGRNIEQTFEETIEQLKGMAKQERPDPHEQEMKLEAAKAQQAIEIKRQDAAADQKLAQDKAASEERIKQMEFDAEQRRMDAELAHKMELERMQLAAKERMALAEHSLARDRMRAEGDIKREQAYLDHDLKSSGQAADQDLAERAAEHKAGLAERAQDAKEAAAAAKTEGGSAPAKPAKPAAPRPAAPGAFAGISAAMTKMATDNAANQQAMIKLIGEMQTTLRQISAPKKVTLQRDKETGRATGATVTAGNA